MITEKSSFLDLVIDIETITPDVWDRADNPINKKISKKSAWT